MRGFEQQPPVFSQVNAPNLMIPTVPIASAPTLFSNVAGVLGTPTSFGQSVVPAPQNPSVSFGTSTINQGLNSPISATTQGFQLPESRPEFTFSNTTSTVTPSYQQPLTASQATNLPLKRLPLLPVNQPTTSSTIPILPLLPVNQSTVSPPMPSLSLSQPKLPLLPVGQSTNVPLLPVGQSTNVPRLPLLPVGQSTTIPSGSQSNQPPTLPSGQFGTLSTPQRDISKLVGPVSIEQLTNAEVQIPLEELEGYAKLNRIASKKGYAHREYFPGFGEDNYPSIISLFELQEKRKESEKSLNIPNKLPIYKIEPVVPVSGRPSNIYTAAINKPAYGLNIQTKKNQVVQRPIEIVDAGFLTSSRIR